MSSASPSTSSASYAASIAWRACSRRSSAAFSARVSTPTGNRALLDGRSSSRTTSAASIGVRREPADVMTEHTYGV